MSRGEKGGLFRGLAIAIPYAWLFALFLVPFVIVLRISLSETAYGQPPYLPVFALEDLAGFLDDLRMLGVQNYEWLAGDALYFNAYLSSVRIAAISTIVALLFGYPLAYAMAKAPPGWKPILLMLVILPFWTSFLIRVYAWIGILRGEGYLNQFLLWTGLIAQPLSLLNTETAVVIGIVYSYLPFMVLPIYASLDRMDHRLIEAANDLGCPPLRAFWQITLPISAPGIIAGSLLVFIPAVGEFVIPDLLGGSSTLMIGKVLWDEFFANRDWPVASAVAILLLILLVVPILIFQRFQERRL